MKVRVEENFIAGSYKVWFYQPRQDGSVDVHQHIHSDMWEVENHPPGSQPTVPSFEIRRDMLEGLVAEAADVLPPSAAVDAHLKDSIKTRDRLLSLVESLVGSST